jgi:type IV pilus assembly protein PilA
MKRLFKSAQEGFTLVELMVVVAIIGVLSAVAVPNFKKYQAKSKSSEAKLQLSAAYTALQSFYSDYDTYHVCLTYMGFNPTNEILQRVYAVGFGSDGTLADATGGCATPTGTGPSDVACLNGAVTGATACAFTAAAGQTFFAAGKRTGSALPLTTFTLAEVSGTLPTVNAFRVGAVGVIDINFATVATASAFNMNEDKKLNQVRPGY